MAELDGDWVEGAAKWWWKYVLPEQSSFWTEVLAAAVDPVPVPWLQGATGQVLEALAMLHASTRANSADGERLRTEAVAKIQQAVAAVPRTEMARGESA
jgi:hypothetical protein